jgi:hypothetical protein
MKKANLSSFLQGYSGDDCATEGETESYDGYSVQVALLVVLLLVSLGLTGVIGLMIYKITEYRKEQAALAMPGSSHGLVAEMVEQRERF